MQARKLDPAILSAWLTERVQNRGLSFYGRLIAVVLCAFFIADIVALMVAKYIPEPPMIRASTGSSFGNRSRTKTFDSYSVIISRNLFNSKGLIPGEAAPKGDPGGTPIKTNLPLNLIGTLVLTDELKSIATIEDKSSGSVVLPLRVEDEIPSKIKVIGIEARRVVFLNLNANRREFVELPEDLTNSNAHIELAPTKTAGIAKVSETQYQIARSELDKTLSDINNVVTQARCVPNFEGGIAQGFKCFQIVPGSIYEKLGMVNGDIITAINGEPLNDVSKAFEAFGKIREMKEIDIQIKRNGRTQNNTYRIN